MKLLKVTVIFICFYIISAADVMAAGSLSVQVLNWDGTTASGGLQFSASKATLNKPWVRSNQYLRVVYSSDRKIWGVRIFTDNNTYIGGISPKLLNKSGTSLSYGGLIDPKTKNNPNYRAALAWQVFQGPVSQPDPIYYDSFLGVWNVGGEWNDDWAYITDKSDMWEGKKSVEDAKVAKVFKTGTYDTKFEIVTAGNFLSQHPVISGSKNNPDPKVDPDGIMAIYIAACFGIMDDKGNYVGILPKGNYGTTIYLELLYE